MRDRTAATRRREQETTRAPDSEERQEKQGAVAHIPEGLSNVGLQRALAPSLQREEAGGATATAAAPAQARPKTLSEALGFPTMMEGLVGMAGQGHPLTADILRRMHGILVARFIDGDDKQARMLAAYLSTTLGKLDLTMAQLGRHAPHAGLWERERFALQEFMSAIRMSAETAASGSYSKGRETYWLNALSALERGLDMAIPAIGPADVKLPGGSTSKKFYLGSAVTPVAIVNFYLTLKITLEGAKPAEGAKAAPEVQLGANVSEEGELKPSASASGTVAGIKGSGEISAGEGGKPQPSVGLETEVGKGDSKLGGAVKVDAEGPQTSLTATAPGGWTNKVTVESDGGLTYSSTHSSGGGVELSGKVDKMTLSVTAPELTAGNAKVSASIDVEVIPVSLAFAKSMTQNAEMIRRYQNLVLALSGIALALPVAGAVAAIELPTILILGGETALSLAPLAAR